MSEEPDEGRRGLRADRRLELQLDGFAWQAVEEESERTGVSVEELISFAVLYYLADVDSGRVSRQITRRPRPQRPL